MSPRTVQHETGIITVRHHHPFFYCLSTWHQWASPHVMKSSMPSPPIFAYRKWIKYWRCRPWLLPLFHFRVLLLAETYQKRMLGTRLQLHPAWVWKPCLSKLWVKLCSAKLVVFYCVKLGTRLGFFRMNPWNTVVYLRAQCPISFSCLIFFLQSCRPTWSDIRLHWMS